MKKLFYKVYKFIYILLKKHYKYNASDCYSHALIIYTSIWVLLFFSIILTARGGEVSIPYFDEHPLLVKVIYLPFGLLMFLILHVVIKKYFSGFQEDLENTTLDDYSLLDKLKYALFFIVWLLCVAFLPILRMELGW